MRDIVWLSSLTLGLIWLIAHFWSRFNVPTHTAKLEFFKKYAPRFATREREFTSARYGYVGLIAVLYLIFSFSPQLIAKIFIELGEIEAFKGLFKSIVDTVGDPSRIAELGVFPLLVAALFTGARTIVGLKSVEYRIRSFFHSLGKVPESVQSTVGQLKSSTFDFRSCCEFSEAQVTRLGEVLGMPKLSDDAVLSDDVLRTWCTIRCLTDRLGRIESGEIAIRDDFLEVYRDELREIIVERDDLQRLVSEYAGLIVGGEDDLMDMNGAGHRMRADARRRVRNLRERLFVFIACGFRSGAATDAEVTNGLRNLGFEIRVQREPDRGLGTLIGAVFLYLICMTSVAALLASQFHDWMGTDDLDPGLSMILMVPAPEDYAVRWLWTLTSGIFSFAAVVAAFAIRRARLNHHDWFRLDGSERERPFLTRYPWTAILSGLAGMVALFCVNVVMGYFFGPPEINETIAIMLATGLTGTYPWFPLAVIVAIASLYVVDDDYLSMPIKERVTLTAACSAIVGLVGGLIAYSRSTSQFDDLKQIGDLPAETTNALPLIEDALPYAALLIGLLVLIQALYMAVILQKIESSAQRSGNLTDRWLNLRTSTGEEQEIFLAKDGSLFALDSKTAEAQSVGRWVQYPECQVLHWDVRLSFGRNALGGTGMLQRESGVIVYTDQSESGAAGDFVAQGSLTERRESVDAASLPRLQVVGA